MRELLERGEQEGRKERFCKGKEQDQVMFWEEKWQKGSERCTPAHSLQQNSDDEDDGNWHS